MHWIALQCPAEDLAAWGWWGLQFTPRVAQVDEALLLEVSTCETLWGGRRQLLQRFFSGSPLESPVHRARGATGLVALALLRLKVQGIKPPADVPDGLPLETLSCAIGHVPMLARAGCQTWGDLRALPRAGVARRFGAPLLEALDIACGVQPEGYRWLGIPDVFDLKLELPALATTAPELMWSAQRLLTQFQVWLQARQRGVLALEFEWTLDLRRLDGKPLPRHEQLMVRTAQPTQDMAHLRRLVSEHLGRAKLSAPAGYLRLRSVETTPWAGANISLLPDDNIKGEKLHQLVERLSVRLGADHVLMAQAQADYRPERMQCWLPAREVLPHVAAPAVVEGLAPEVREAKPRPRRKPVSASAASGATAPATASDALYPSWLLPEPLRLEMCGEVPQYGGLLRRLVRLYRVETGWWEEGRSVRRDYFIARSEAVGLVWIYEEHTMTRQGLAQEETARWYLQGLYA